MELPFNGMNIPGIDNGYIRLVDRWGSDAAIVEAARMSTDKGFIGWHAESHWHCDVCNYTMIVEHNDESRVVEHEPVNVHAQPMMPGPGHVFYYVGLPPRHRMRYMSGHNGDERLLRYLYTHKHMTPFEMAGCTFEIQAPIFVFREWHRHRTQSYNELSARYTELPEMFYIPTIDVLRERMAAAQSSNNKQEQAQPRGVLGIFDTPADRALETIHCAYQDARDNYKELLAMGVPRELARIVVPVGQISRMRASANLRNWLGFLTLRMDAAAQWEIRQYANALGAILSDVFPRTWKLFADGLQR